jgi:hypothetical protein
MPRRAARDTAARPRHIIAAVRHGFIFKHKHSGGEHGDQLQKLEEECGQ